MNNLLKRIIHLVIVEASYSIKRHNHHKHQGFIVLVVLCSSDFSFPQCCDRLSLQC